MILIPDYLIYAMWSALCLIAVTVRVLHYAYVARRSVMFFVIGKNIAQVVAFGCVAYAIRYPESGQCCVHCACGRGLLRCYFSLAMFG